VYQLELEDSIQAIYDKTALYGHFVDECGAATETISATQTEVEEIEAAVAGLDRPRVLYHFFGFAAGSETFIHELLEAAGGTNLAAEAGISGYVEISDEVVVEEDPEWIVAPSHAGLPEGEPYASTTALRSEQTLVVDEKPREPGRATDRRSAPRDGRSVPSRGVRRPHRRADTDR